MKNGVSNNQILLEEIIEQDFIENGQFDNKNDFFEYFTCVHLLKDYDLNDEEIYYGLTGGGNDGGCDGIYIFLNDSYLSTDQFENLSAYKGSKLTLIIIQTKNTRGFNETVIEKWKTLSENLLELDNKGGYEKRYCERVLNRFSMFRETIKKLIRSQIKIEIFYYYVTLANQKHPNVVKQSNELIEKVKKLYPSACVDVKLVGADELFKAYSKNPEINIELEFAATPINLGFSNDYIALVNLCEYYRFITNEDGKIRNGFFEANVRDYQGNNAVNSSINRTLLNGNNEDFWWLNNGITILSEEIKPLTQRKLTIKNPEIVNGLQTSTEIYNYFTSNPCKLDHECREKRNVLVRIIQPETEESRDNIIFSTNNQTNIPKSSLRATDPIHLKIEQYFKSKGLYYDRRKNYYRNQNKKPSEIVSVSFLAQCLISVFLRQPDFARARPSTVLADDDTYKKLYEDYPNLEIYYKIAFLGKRIDSNLRKTINLTPTERSDILFYLLYGVVAEALKKKQIEFSDIESFDVFSLEEDFINNKKEKIYNRYKELGGNSQVAKSRNFINEIDSILDICTY